MYSAGLRTGCPAAEEIGSRHELVEAEQEYYATNAAAKAGRSASQPHVTVVADRPGQILRLQSQATARKRRA